MELTLDRLIELVGPITDGSRASKQLRALLSEDSDFEFADLEAFLTEARTGTESYHHRAYQDIVNNLGERLGFCTQYGTYAGNASPIPYDGLWFTDSLRADVTYMTVEAKKSVSPPGAPEKQVGGYMERLCERWNLDQADVFGIVVADKGDLSVTATDIRESKYAGQVRVISVWQLFVLLKLKRDYALTHGRVAELLFSPDAADLNTLIKHVEASVAKVEFWRGVERETGIQRNGTAITFNGDFNHKENFEHFVGHLFEKGLITEAELPVAVSSRVYLNTEPEKLSGAPMNSPTRISDDVYLDTAFKQSIKKSFMERLALEYGPESLTSDD
jgi:hypothetical protein